MAALVLKLPGWMSRSRTIRRRAASPAPIFSTSSISTNRCARPTRPDSSLRSTPSAIAPTAPYSISTAAWKKTMALPIAAPALSTRNTFIRRTTRFAKLGVIVSMQPYHAIDDGRWAETILGPQRIKSSYAWKSLLDAGATLAFGSDWPVAPLDPVMGIYAATTRRTLDGKNPNGWIPEQRITVAQAVHAYPMGSAFAEHQETVKGSIEPGKLADLVVLSDDIFTIPPEAIEKTRVDMTI